MELQTPTDRICNLTTEVLIPYQVSLSSDLIDNMIEIEISTRGKHKTLGLIFEQKLDMGGRLQLKDCARSKPSARIPKWRSNLRLSFLHAADGKEINTQSDV